MTRLRAYLRRHHVGLIALLLVVSGGAAYAANLPKNSVKSSTVKNNSLKGKDLKDRSVVGADLRDGTVGAVDLAPGVVPRSDLIHVKTETGQTSTLFSDPLIGTITLACNGSSNWQVFVQLPSTATPGIAGVVGSDLSDQAPVGASSFSNSNPGGSGGAVFFGGPGNVVGHFTAYFDTPTKRLHMDADVSPSCVLRGTLDVRDRPGPPVLVRTAAKPGGGPTCQDVVGDAGCTVSRSP